MLNKIIKILSAGAVLLLLSASLSGCGNNTETDDISAKDENIVVDEKDENIVATEESEPDRSYFYKPQEFADMDFDDPSSQWCFERSKESEHFILFWESGFGDNPNSADLPEEMRVDTDDLLAKVERFYRTECEELGFGTGSVACDNANKSYLDTYKMEIYLLYQEEWLATGAGYDDVIGALWVNPSTCQPVGAVIAHEIGHSFQYQISCDALLNNGEAEYSSDGTLKNGFRYAYCDEIADGYGCTFWEQCAEWQAWQDYPEEAFTWYYEELWTANCHRAFENEWIRYQSYWMQYELAEQFGEDSIGTLWSKAEYPEDAIDAATRIFCDGDRSRFNLVLYDYASHAATYDFAALSEVTDGRWLDDYSTTLYDDGEGWQQVAYADCPDDGGFNVIKLDGFVAGDTVNVDFETLPIGTALAVDDPGEYMTGEDGTTVGGTVRNYNSVYGAGSENDSSKSDSSEGYDVEAHSLEVEDAEAHSLEVEDAEAYSLESDDTDGDAFVSGHTYGFVAYLHNGERVYSEPCSDKEGTVSFTVPKNTQYVYLVVAGTPNMHIKHIWNNDESDDLQLPYRIKIY